MQKRSVASAAIAGGVLIFILKVVAYLISGSVALLSDALESIVNIVASIMMFLSIMVASRPQDSDHNYGHNKIENISCFIEGVLVLLAGYFIIEAAVGRLYVPTGLFNLNFALVISLAATALNVVLSFSLSKVSKETGSLALEGDAKHLLSDVLSSIGVILGLVVVSITGWVLLDPIIAILVAILIIRMGIGLCWKASKDLMDHACQEEELKIKNVLLSHKARYIEFHDLKTRRSGGTVFAEFHLCVDGDMNVSEAHDLTKYFEGELKREVPGIQTTIHVETQNDALSACNKSKYLN